MPRQTPSRLIRSNSYLNLLRPYLNEQRLSTYATCPPINLHYKRMQQNDRQKNSLRAFDFGLQPSLHSSQSQISTATSRKTVTQYDWQRSSTSSNVSEKVDKKIKSSIENSASKQMVTSEKLPQCYSSTIMKHSLPVFEVLPPLASNSNQRLVYENFFALDGVSCDISPSQSQSRVGCGKLKLDYLKFLKSINKKRKPSDYDIIFGNAKVFLASSCGWERSRIEWLLELERRHEASRRRKNIILLEENADEEFTNACCFPFNIKMLLWNPKSESTA